MVQFASYLRRVLRKTRLIFPRINGPMKSLSQLYKTLRRTSIGNLSKNVFEPRTSTGSEAFSLLICLDANKFVLLSFFSLIKTIYQRVSTEPLPNDAKSPLPVEVRPSKTLLLKLPINNYTTHALTLV